MDPLRLAIACVPLSAYLLLLGVVNLRRRPLLTTGAADLAALGVALTGFVFVGPIELFHDPRMSADLGNFIWLFWLLFYWVSLSLAVLVARPRLVIYNASLEEVRPALADAAREVDREARWAGDNLVLPQLGVQLHLDGFGIMRHVTMKSSGGEQSLEGWRRLRKAVARSLKPLEVRPNPRSVSFLLLSAALFTITLLYLVNNPIEVAKAMTEIFAF